MGIRGSSTCPLILNDCQVPVENVLGEIGKGHLIAFNVLNVGRFKLGAGSVGAARHCIESAIAYARQRKAFDKVIADFGLIREKLANMAVGIFTGEAMAYRTVGQMDASLARLGDAHDDMAQVRKVIDEYAVECSILKVWGSEFLDYVVDEMVQIYGGYGFVEEYPAERAYRDSRINRIFEGTNEINRLVITGFLLKRAMSGHLPLMVAIKKLMDEVLSGMCDEHEEGPLTEERRLVAAAKKIGLFAAGIATQKYMQALQNEQEILGAIADMAIEAYAMESAVLRTRKIVARHGESSAALATAMTRVYLMSAIERVESAAKIVLAAASEGDLLRTHMAILRRLCKFEPFNSVALRQMIAQRVIDVGKYTAGIAHADRPGYVRCGSPFRSKDARSPRPSSVVRVAWDGSRAAPIGCLRRGVKPAPGIRPSLHRTPRSYPRTDPGDLGTFHVTFIRDPRHRMESPTVF